ncbi:MAG: histone-like nucleoid-structuring protein Lsr2 [Rhodococcus sp. (in: high G+C Gram-positive bacteria)]|uniref:Lsr2 dimerization domain-containing protein n=1 Tax=Rhodococcus sp. TaxID=1831 RepID=UPI002ADAAD25|nr:histone-like nucleoid-structuring protein Lsr2 [Rhodococcus sp. (in: high G+C Gram-positive bacteria)]
MERLIRQCVDDLDGLPVEDDLNQRIEFSFRGTDYVIDLRPANADKMKAVLRQYISVARVEATAVSPATGVEESFDYPCTGGQLQVILRWAKMHNYAASPSGNVTKQIVQAFNAAHR